MNRLKNYFNKGCFFIAEIGNNHAGSLDLAKELVNEAKRVGATAVKFQKRHNDSLFTSAYGAAPYIGRNSYGATYLEHRNAVELSESHMAELKKYCDELGILFFCTPFDLISLSFLEEIGVAMYKIASADIVYQQLLMAAAKTGKPLLISTGGSTLEEVSRAYNLVSEFNKDIAILQCTAAYPCNVEDLNLAVIQTYSKMFPDAILGISDHQSGVSMPIAAYLMGARIFEKHFTLHRSWKGTDNAFSLEPEGFRRMVRDILSLPLALGSEEKSMLECERGPIYKMRKSAYSNKTIEVGEQLTYEMIDMKCPHDGLNGFEIIDLIGKFSQARILPGMPIKLDDFK